MATIRRMRKGWQVLIRKKGHPHIAKTFANYSLATKYAQESEANIAKGLFADLSEANQGNVNISIFDMTGREVANIHNGWLNSGYHQFAWDAGNVASGNYFAIISAPGFTDRIKMTLIK